MDSLKIDFEAAEKIKKEFSFASEDLICTQEAKAEDIKKIKTVSQSLSAVSEKLIKSIKKSICLENLSSGIVLTGGGAQLKGFTELAQFLFESLLKKLF